MFETRPVQPTDKTHILDKCVHPPNARICTCNIAYVLQKMYNFDLYNLNNFYFVIMNYII